MEGLIPVDVIHMHICSHLKLPQLARCMRVSHHWLRVFRHNGALNHIKAKICSASPVLEELFVFQKKQKTQVPESNTWFVLKTRIYELCFVKGIRTALETEETKNCVAAVIGLNFKDVPREVLFHDMNNHIVIHYHFEQYVSIVFISKTGSYKKAITSFLHIRTAHFCYPQALLNAIRQLLGIGLKLYPYPPMLMIP